MRLASRQVLPHPRRLPPAVVRLSLPGRRLSTRETTVRRRRRLGYVDPLQSDDPYTGEYLSGGDQHPSVGGVELDELSDAGAYHDAGVVGAPSGAEEFRPVGVAGGAGHKGAQVEVAGPDSATVGCPNQDVAVGVGYEDSVAVVAPLEVADGGAPVVDELHHRSAVVVSPHDDRPRGIAGGDLVELLVPLHYGYLWYRERERERERERGREGNIFTRETEREITLAKMERNSLEKEPRLKYYFPSDNTYTTPTRASARVKYCRLCTHTVSPLPNNPLLGTSHQSRTYMPQLH